MTSVSVGQLYKVFGPQPQEVVRRLRDGASQGDVRSEGATAAVIDASFDVHDGETFVVMGLSGSGKSTLIRMVNGLLRPTAGQVHVDGHDVTGMKPKELRAIRQSTMSMVFQHFALFPHRTVLDNAGYGLHVQGLARDETTTRARESLELVGLRGWEDRYPQQLSGGMRQRVGLARALAAGTGVLLMDEAFSALDPLIKREMQDQLVQLQATLGKTIVFITHDLNEAMRLGDRIAIMRAGRIVQIGTSEQILNEPADEYVATFVRDVDRSRVLTAASIVRSDAGTISADASPTEALGRMREQGADRLFVADADGRFLGVLTARSAEHAGHDVEEVGAAVLAVADTVDVHTPVHALFPRLAGDPAPVAVLDDHSRLLGVVTHRAVLSALSNREQTRPDPDGVDSAALKEASPSDA